VVTVSAVRCCAPRLTTLLGLRGWVPRSARVALRGQLCDHLYGRRLGRGIHADDVDVEGLRGVGREGGRRHSATGGGPSSPCPAGSNPSALAATASPGPRRTDTLTNYSSAAALPAGPVRVVPLYERLALQFGQRPAACSTSRTLQFGGRGGVRRRPALARRDWQAENCGGVVGIDCLVDRLRLNA
jgi:hypothetical protein